MTRDIQPCGYTIKELGNVTEQIKEKTLSGWLLDMAGNLGQAGDQSPVWLLAHADDGVIWGTLQGTLQEKQLLLSSAVFPNVSPPLRPQTLRQARLFGERDEVLLWRGGDGAWHARRIQDLDKPSAKHWYFDEPQIQWGDHVVDEKDGFTLVSDGQQGLLHAVPLKGIKEKFDRPEDEHPDRWHPLRLGVRHYLAAEDDGALYIVQSRLTGLYLHSRPRKEVRDGSLATT